MTHAIGKPDLTAFTTSRWIVCALASLVLMIGQAHAIEHTATGGQVSQQKTSDEILLLSTRAIGTQCNHQVMEQGLRCMRLSKSEKGKMQWQEARWQDTITPQSTTVPTYIYVHGNRVSSGEDRTRGMMIYRSLQRHRAGAGPIRFVIWSWPSSTIPGAIKDYKVKARRTRPVSWQLAWYLNHLPGESDVSILGYSYGARITSGAMHVLAGGSLSGLQLEIPQNKVQPTYRIALLAAAFDADWILPGHYHGRAVSQVERVILATNNQDPAMRFFHLSNGRGRVHALGKSGVPTGAFGNLASRVRMLNMTGAVGRSHYLKDYLAASSRMRVIWDNLTPIVDTDENNSLALSAAGSLHE